MMILYCSNALELVVFLNFNRLGDDANAYQGD